MIRLTENVPQVYADQSRDFQLFLRVLDCVQNGVKFDIDSMVNILDPSKVSNRLLPLLAERVGFFPRRELNSNMLRYIISAFPYLIKYKGSKKGIEEAIAVVLKADNIYANWNVSIYNSQHSIEITIDKDYDYQALNELLEYIIPTGYTTTLALGNSLSVSTELTEVNIINILTDPAVSISQVVSDVENFKITTSSITREEASEYNNSSKTIEYNQDTGDYKITYIYYDVDGSQIYKNTIELNVYNNDNNRYIGTIGRTEIIGSSNDLSFYDGTSSIDSIDSLDTIYSGDTVVRDDLSLMDQGELSTQESKVVLRTSSLLNEDVTTLNKNVISGATRGVIQVGYYIVDNIGSLGEVTNVEGNNITIETRVYNGTQED